MTPGTLRQRTARISTAASNRMRLDISGFLDQVILYSQSSNE